MADEKSVSLSNLTAYTEKIKELYATKTELSDAETSIEANVTSALQSTFFTKDETKDYVDNKLDTKVDKVDGYGLSSNDFSDTYKDTLDNLNLDNVVEDSNYVHTDNNFTNTYKQKIDNLTNDSKYIGLFDTLTDRDSYNETLTVGLWCSVLADDNYSQKKTKYIYDGTSWIYGGTYTDDEFLIDDTVTDSENVGWSAKKLTTELDLKANKSDVETSIDEINDKLDKKLEINNLVAGTNISIDTDQYGNATINSTVSGTGSDTGTTNYEMLSNKPKINGITVIGEKSSEDLGLLDISYASTDNENSVKMADKAKEIDIEGQLDGTAKYYGVASGGTDVDNTLKLRPFPVGTATNRIDTLEFELLTKDVPQAIPFAREITDINCFVQAFKQEDSELNVTEVFENYTNENIGNYSENVICDSINGLNIKDSFEYNTVLNNDGFYETNIISNNFINIKKIEVR